MSTVSSSSDASVFVEDKETLFQMIPYVQFPELEVAEVGVWVGIIGCAVVFLRNLITQVYNRV